MKLTPPRLAPPRLLPVVIAATAALLLFKGIGLMTDGGYVLVGTSEVAAAGGAPAPADHGGSGGGGEAAGGHGGEASMVDQNPTIEDTSDTMKLTSGAAEGGGHGGSSEGEAEAGDHAATPEVGPADSTAGMGACPPTDAAAADAGGHGGEPAADAAGHGGEPASDAAGHGSEPAADAGGHGSTTTGAATPSDPCLADPGVNEYGDALPLIKDNATGKMVPLADVTTDSSSEAAINERLSERRATLDDREKELEMRAALVDAAEKRLEERSAELKALEESIGKAVDNNKTAEQQQFTGLVAMYETMKPKDAATIFNQLDLPVLLGLAKAMNPRKMAPILAKMDPMKAKALTDGIAASEAPADPGANVAAAQDLTNLPQIVGQ
jgi:flagellar motility protein MotE (MotC chaperone)